MPALHARHSDLSAQSILIGPSHRARLACRAFLACLLLAAAAALPAPARAAEGEARAAAPAADALPDALVGKWTGGQEFIKMTIRFLPDGRYDVVYTIGGEKSYEHGTAALRDDRLAFHSSGGASKTYTVKLADDRLNAVADGEVAEYKFERAPGSEKTVIAEVRKEEEAARKIDAAWEKFYAVAPAADAGKKAISVIGEGEGNDPNAAKVFDEGSFFAKEQLYVKYWRPDVTYVVVRGKDPGTGKSQTRICFLPNGRVFYKDIRYTGGEAGRPGRVADARVTVLTQWGRYKIQAGALTLVTDKGEVIKMKLTNGRRTIAWDDTIYTEVGWLNQALKNRDKAAAGRAEDLLPPGSARE